MEIINNKFRNYELYKLGKFGNKLRTWYSIKEFLDSNYIGSVTIRYSGEHGGMYVAYNVLNVNDKIQEFVKAGADIDKFIINESAPDDDLLIQGELMRTYSGYSLFYSTEKGKMRDCLRNGIQINGLNAKIMLQKYLFPSSFEDLMELLNIYVDHVIEFSTYVYAIGDCENRNTIIWEVRKY